MNEKFMVLTLKRLQHVVMCVPAYSVFDIAECSFLIKTTVTAPNERQTRNCFVALNLL